MEVPMLLKWQVCLYLCPFFRLNGRRVKRQTKEYTIPFLGLKLGKHDFDLRVKDDFFGRFDYSEIHEADITVHVELEKKETLLSLHFTLDGKVRVLCDRCGDEIDQPIHSEERLVVKLGDETGTTDDEVLVLGPAEHEVDLSQYLYEFAHLALPVKHTHPVLSDCNQRVLKELETLRVEHDADARWEALKNLEHLDKETDDTEEE
jgi:uncharacterized metal-binding protein YceD (DUF177 family)